MIPGESSRRHHHANEVTLGETPRPKEMNADRHSMSPINGKSYEIPANESKISELDGFIARNLDRIPIVVQGLGFVGAMTALVCSNTRDSEYAVIGVDLPTPASYWRIAALNEGVFPVAAEDPKIQKMFLASQERGNLFATHETHAYSKAEIILVDVNLDVADLTALDSTHWSYAPKLKLFEAAVQTIASHCREDALIIVETTVPPGTCEKIVYPLLKDGLASRGLRSDKIMLGHSYERVMPGPDYVSSMTDLPRVYSGVSKESADATQAFLSSILGRPDTPLSRLQSTTASEIGKVLENSYRAANIAFIDEWTRYAEAAGVNLVEIIDAIRLRPTHSNLMYPGIGVGGYCLTKDPLLASWSSREFFGIEEGMPSREQDVRVGQLMPGHAFQRLRKHAGHLAGKKLLLLGVTYRGGVADTRLSPVLHFLNSALAEGMSVFAHDPLVSHWPESNLDVFSDFGDAASVDPDIIAMTARHHQYQTQEFVFSLLDLRNCLIFDTVGILSPQAIALLSRKHVVKVLGRGDL